MFRAWRYGLSVLLLASLLAAAASVAIDFIGRRWFERDVDLRAELVWRSARNGLADDLDANNHKRLQALLDELGRDDKISGAAVCVANAKQPFVSAGYRGIVTCEMLLAEVRESGSFSSSLKTDLGLIHITAHPVPTQTKSAALVLIHDLGFLEQRESAMRNVLVGLLLGLGVLASLVTLASARWSLRRTMRELKSVLLGDHAAGEQEFGPLFSDVKALMAQFGEERITLGAKEPWSPATLKNTLSNALEGDRIIVVANREPYIHSRDVSGHIQTLHPASGLVTALEPVMRACSGVWVAHGSGNADRETSDARGRLLVPPSSDAPDRYTLRRVWLTKEQESGYYYGFANEGLWPLCHIADARPTFRKSDWDKYREVNEMFADAVVEEASTDDPVVLVQDYHFALAPRMIRERLPRATIITFWHIPWPNPERFSICPWTREILNGLLGSSIIGFHTHYHCQHFVESIDRFLEARVDREDQAIVLGGRQTLVRPYPISIEWPPRWAEKTPAAEQSRREITNELGLRSDALIGVGIDRIDYTKGIEERLLAVERTLERFPEYVGRLVFLQVGAPSRTELMKYQKLNDDLVALVGRINERFREPGYEPIVLLRAHHDPAAVYRYYRAADFCYVSSLHDGMNLVAKEFCAAREDEQGVLLLSVFTGAARELSEALIVNPYDLENASDAIHAALSMPKPEQRERMRAMRRWIKEYNVYRWAAKMLLDASRLRQRERMYGRIMKRPALTLLRHSQFSSKQK